MNHDSDSDAVYSDRAERTPRLTVMAIVVPCETSPPTCGLNPFKSNVAKS